MTLNELYKQADYKDGVGMMFNADCLDIMAKADLIFDNSNIGQIVFDPCAGSGAHCYVAKRLDRKYIGVELDEQYFDVAVERMGG